MGSMRLLGAARALGRDDSVLKETVRPGTAKRMLKFSRPYATLLATFMVVVIVDAVVGVANPFVYKYIINNGILKGNIPLIVDLAVLAAILGALDATLGLAQS